MFELIKTPIIEVLATRIWPPHGYVSHRLPDVTGMQEPSEAELRESYAIHGLQVLYRLTFWHDGDGRAVTFYDTGNVYSSRREYLPFSLLNQIDQYQGDYAFLNDLLDPELDVPTDSWFYESAIERKEPVVIEVEAIVSGRLVTQLDAQYYNGPMPGLNRIPSTTNPLQIPIFAALNHRWRTAL